MRDDHRRRGRLFGVFVLTLLGCAHRSDGAPLSEELVSLKRVGLVRERPPKARVLFDVRVRGAATGPRWVILPERTDVEHALDALKTDGVEVWSIRSGSASTTIGRFQGVAGFVAIPIPKSGELVLHGLALATWSAEPSAIDVLTADEVIIGGEPIDARMGSGASVAGELRAESAQRASSRFTPDRHEIEVVPKGARRHRHNL